MTRVAVLGDSLSIVGHGCHGMKRVQDTWPNALERELGDGVHVSVYGQARLTCADGPESKTYFGYSPWLTAALMLMLGTNDVRSTGCTFDDMVKGCSQLVLLRRAGAKIHAGTVIHRSESLSVSRWQAKHGSTSSYFL